MFNNQGYSRQDFRAALALVRIIESSVTGVTYYFLGIYSVESMQLVPVILPSVLIGIPFGAWLIGKIEPEVFRRICMSFDAWVVGFGLSRTLNELAIIQGSAAYLVLAAAVIVDVILLYRFFKVRGRTRAGFGARAPKAMLIGH